MATEHITVAIDRPADAVYTYASDPANLTHWAAGLVEAPLTQVDGQWGVDTPGGRTTIDFAPANPYGVLDHKVTMPSGETFYNPMRIIPDGDDRCEAVFTVRQQPGVSDEELARDVAAVRADLQTLRGLMEED